MKILLLEDDLFICEQIKSYFELFDNKVDFFNDGEALLDNAILSDYDIFLFDINTPKKDGFQTLKEIRESGNTTPIIYLTAQSDLEHIKKGFALGCSDYIKKPFLLEEVELRIKQILHKNAGDTIKLSSNYSFEIETMQLFFKNKIVELKNTEKSLLYVLIKNIGNIVSSNDIKDYVWDEKVVCDNTLRTQIKKIRTKLKDNFIVNIRNAGYKIEKYD